MDDGALHKQIIGTELESESTYVWSLGAEAPSWADSLRPSETEKFDTALKAYLDAEAIPCENDDEIAQKQINEAAELWSKLLDVPSPNLSALATKFRILFAPEIGKTDDGGEDTLNSDFRITSLYRELEGFARSEAVQSSQLPLSADSRLTEDEPKRARPSSDELVVALRANPSFSDPVVKSELEKVAAGDTEYMFGRVLPAPEGLPADWLAIRSTYIKAKGDLEAACIITDADKRGVPMNAQLKADYEAISKRSWEAEADVLHFPVADRETLKDKAAVLACDDAYDDEDTARAILADTRRITASEAGPTTTPSGLSKWDVAKAAFEAEEALSLARPDEDWSADDLEDAMFATPASKLEDVLYKASRAVNLYRKRGENTDEAAERLIREGTDDCASSQFQIAAIYQDLCALVPGADRRPVERCAVSDLMDAFAANLAEVDREFEMAAFNGPAHLLEHEIRTRVTRAQARSLSGALFQIAVAYGRADTADGLVGKVDAVSRTDLLRDLYEIKSLLASALSVIQRELGGEVNMAVSDFAGNPLKSLDTTHSADAEYFDAKRVYEQFIADGGKVGRVWNEESKDPEFVMDCTALANRDAVAIRRSVIASPWKLNAIGEEWLARQDNAATYCYGEIDPLTASEPISDQLTALWARLDGLDRSGGGRTDCEYKSTQAQIEAINRQIGALEELASWQRASSLKGALLALGLISRDAGVLVDIDFTGDKRLSDDLEEMGMRIRRHVHSAIEGIDRTTGEFTKSVCGAYAEARMDAVRLGRGQNLVVGKPV